MQADETFAFGADDLRLPVTLYDLRQQTSGDPVATELLDRAANRMFSADCAVARGLLAEAAVSVRSR
jgi:hypothetical protein